MTFSNILNKYMQDIGCSSKELANASSLSQSIISRYKNGERIPTNDNLKKISDGLQKISNKKLNSNDILKEFNKIINKNDIDFETVRNNLNTLINTLNINASELSKYLNFDASYLSKIRSGNRIPSNKKEFINTITNFIFKKSNNEECQNKLCTIMNVKKELSIDIIKIWLMTNNKQQSNEINNFLEKIDSFDLNNYIKAIKFDQLKVPYVPFYKVRTKNYFGIEEMKKGELDFFKGTVLSKSKDDIFMCSDMPIEDMAEDIEFGKKWMFAIAMSLKKGLHLNIIHNLDRPFKEMMLGLESWIPIYMTGQVSPYYLPESKNTIYQHINYVSGSVALTGECIKGFHDKGKYYITNNKKEINYYKQKASLLIKKANSLMDIYREENKNNYQLFLLNDKKVIDHRKRYFSSLPLFTIQDDLLISILKRNKISNKDIKEIVTYKKEEEENIKFILDNNTIDDNIYKFTNEEFNDDDVYLSLENIFYNKKIKYTYDEYLEHFKSTINFSKHNKNYNIIFNKNRTFKNINITILKNNYVILSKNENPTIHFIIKHPKLISAIDTFDPVVIEK